MSRRWAAFGSGSVVVLGAVSSAFINELGRGWLWWAGACVVVAGAAGITAWLALRPSDQRRAGDRLDRAAVKVTGSVTGGVETLSYGASMAPGQESGGDQLGPGAVLVEGDVDGWVRTKSFGPGAAPDGKDGA
jgi:hypothetical protein